MPALFDGVRAPSTLGSFLRSLTWGNVRQLGTVSRELLAGLVSRAGLLRGGNASSARGAASLITEAVGTARQAGCTGTIVVRMDSAYYSAAACHAARRAGALFSVTARMDPAVRAAIARIDEGAWTPIKYPRAVWDEQQGRWISDAEVAEVKYTAFASVKGKAITARLIVRRVKDLNPKARQRMDELFPVWRYHAVLTGSPFVMLQAEEQHRDHTVIEQAFADLTSGPLAHAPSGRFAANAAWLALAAIAHNLTRAAGALASARHARARGVTIRADLIDVAARTARHGRGHLTLHLPEGWHRQADWENCSPPPAPAPRPGGLTSPDLVKRDGTSDMLSPSRSRSQVL
jgi:Transposase DDE domain group 1